MKGADIVRRVVVALVSSAGTQVTGQHGFSALGTSAATAKRDGFGFRTDRGVSYEAIDLVAASNSHVSEPRKLPTDNKVSAVNYEIMILDRDQIPWSVHSPEAKAVNAISLDTPPFTDDMVRESAKNALEQRKKYARWLDDDDAIVVANAMLIIIGRAMNMLKSQIRAQGKSFEEAGGFSERLMAKRIEAREKDRPPAPECPLCGKPMRQRNSARGQFWGCSAFPDCKGTRTILEG